MYFLKFCQKWYQNCIKQRATQMDPLSTDFYFLTQSRNILAMLCNHRVFFLSFKFPLTEHIRSKLKIELNSNPFHSDDHSIRIITVRAQ